MSLKSLIFPTEAERASRLGPALLILRAVCGIALMHHGWRKIQDPFGWMGPDATTPGIFQALAALAEFGGGLAWILGLLTPLASLGVLCTMIVAITGHVGRGDPFVGKGSWELAALYATVAVLLGLAGPGRFSLDALILRSKEASTRDSAT